MFMHSVLHSRTSPPRRSAHSTIHRTSPRVSPTPAPSPCSVHTRARRTVYEVQYILLSMGVSQSQWEDVNQQHYLIRERDKQPKQTPKQTPTTPTTTYLDERVTSGVEDFVFEVRGRQRRDRGRGKSTATQQQQHKERRHGTAQHIDVMDGIF